MNSKRGRVQCPLFLCVAWVLFIRLHGQRRTPFAIFVPQES